MAMVSSTLLSIPQHLAEETMESLPVKAIVRFKSLSKHYFSHFTSFSFIYTHYLLSSLKPSLIIPLHCNPWLVNFNISNIKKETTTNLVIAPPFPTSYQTRIVSCCFGLLCVSLTTFHTDVVVWNPATREFRTLPESSIDIVEFWRTRSIIKICLGFGFDRDFKDFKVVRIVSHFINETDSTDVDVEVEVFRRSTGTWRLLDLTYDGVIRGFDMEETKITDRFPAAVVNGVIYWNAFEKHPDWWNQHFIVAFDISDETFRRIPLPVACEDASHWCIIKWQNSIAAFVPQIQDQETSTVFDVWVMRNGCGSSDDDDEEVRWVKLMSIGGFPDSTFPITAANDDHDQIMMKTKKKDRNSTTELIVYDIKTKQSKNLKIEGANHVYMAHHYVESLVSVYGDEG